MTIGQRIHAQVALVVLVVVSLAATNWILMPDKAVSWMLAMGTVAVAWAFAAVAGKARPFAEQSASERGYLLASIVIAGAILAAALSIKMAKHFGLDGGEWLARGFGVAVGVALVVLGNTMPKILGSLTAQRCSQAQGQSIQRLGGWSFVIAGLVGIGAWLFLSVEQARDWQMYSTMAALTLLILRVAWAFLGPSSAGSATRN